MPTDFPADLVGISVITGCARPAYELANHYRKRGIPVVLGGVHVSVLPGEALAARRQHCRGPWRTCVAAADGGFPSRSNEASLPGASVGRWRPGRRSFAAAFFAATQRLHGAQHGAGDPRLPRVCDFCTVPAVWPQYLKRPIADVVRDIRTFSGKTIAFNDVSLVDDAEYAKELFTAMIPAAQEMGRTSYGRRPAEWRTARCNGRAAVAFICWSASSPATRPLCATSARISTMRCDTKTLFADCKNEA